MNENKVNLKTIYLPQYCYREPPGLLLGVSNPEDTVFYVIAIVHFPITPRDLNSYLQKHQNLGKHDIDFVNVRPLGTWYPVNSWEGEDDDFRTLVPNLFGQDKWLSVIACKAVGSSIGISLKVEHLEKSGFQSQDIFADSTFIKSAADSIVVMYQQKELWDGEVSTDSVLKMGEQAGCLETLLKITKNCKSGILSYESGLNPEENVSVSHCCVQRELSIAYFLVAAFTNLFLIAINSLNGMVRTVLDSLPSWIQFIFKILGKCMEFSSFSSHVKRRVTDFSKSLLRVVERNTTDLKNLEDFDITASVFVDILLGLLFLWILGNYGLLWSGKTTREVFLPYVDTIAAQVEELIKWLMGIPAGLKLNHPLNQFLGNFFLYHVRLWLEYAKMMMDLFPSLITYCLMCSCMGLSFFLTIVADTISTLSFHVYCFYVYAGRLYGLQLSGLMSMWRLFRGKKWNPLRKRVDSLEESGQRADQLFAGTLLFTVLLFLLPTTALYYGIFALLRIVVLGIQVLLSWMVFISSEFPYYSTAMRLSQPHKFIKSMKIKWLSPSVDDANNQNVKHKENHAIVLWMQIDPVSIVRVIKVGLAKRGPTTDRVGIRSFLKKAITGDLIRWS